MLSNKQQYTRNEHGMAFYILDIQSKIKKHAIKYNWEWEYCMCPPYNIDWFKKVIVMMYKSERIYK